MHDNLQLGPDAQLRFAIDGLKSSVGTTKLTHRTPLAEGVFFDSDPDVPCSGKIVGTADNLLSVSLSGDRSSLPRWQAIHFDMGPADLTNSALLGVLATSKAPSSVTARFCLRSGTHGTFSDHFFPKTLVAFGEASRHLDVLELAKIPDAPRVADWRQLIIFLRPGSVELTISDLRAFIA